MKGGGEEYVHVVVQNEELLPAVLHDVLAEMIDEEADGDGLAVLVMGGEGELVLPLISEQHLETTPEASKLAQNSSFPPSLCWAVVPSSLPLRPSSRWPCPLENTSTVRPHDLGATAGRNLPWVF